MSSQRFFLLSAFAVSFITFSQQAGYGHITQDCSSGACPSEGPLCSSVSWSAGNCVVRIVRCLGWEGDCAEVNCSGSGCIQFTCYHDTEDCTGTAGNSVNQCSGKCFYPNNDCRSVKMTNTGYTPAPSTCLT